MKPYEEYQNSQANYIGVYPSHWELTKLRFIFQERKEKNGDKKEKNILSVMRNKGVIPYSEKGNVGNKHSEDIGRYNLVCEDDIVMNSMNVIIGSVGRSRYNGVLSPVYYVLKNRNYEDVNVKYYENVFRMTSLQRELTKYGKGILAHRMRIPMELLKNLELTLPPKEEQDQIVRYLDSKLSRINKFIKAKKKQIELLKEQKQAIINQAVTKGIDSDAKMKPSGIDWLGDIPEGWEVRPLKHFVKSNIETLTESFDKNATINYIDISTVGFGELKLKPVQYVFKEAPSRARRVIHVGDTIISTVRTYLKSMCYIDEELEGYIASTGFAVLTPSKEVFSKFLNYILSADYFVNMVSQNSIGVSYPAITESKLVTIKIAISPDIEEQKEILEYIKPKTIAIDKAIVAIKKEIDLITEYRTTLISNVVTGKVDVRHIEGEDIIDSIEEYFEDLDEGELIEELEMEEE